MRRPVRRLARFLVDLEVTVWVSLARWIARRPDVPAGAQPVGYSRMVTPVLCLWIFASAAEIPLAHILIPWDWLRLSLLVVGIWGLLWMVGFLASLRVYPHLVDDEGLRVRGGRRVDLRIAWSDVASVAKVDRDLESTMRSLQPLQTAKGVDLQVGVSGRTNVHVALARPRPVQTTDGPVEVVALTFWVDDPADFVRDVRPRIRRGSPVE